MQNMGDGRKWGKSRKIVGNFQMVISWVFWKLFELCKSLKYSSGSQLSNEYKNIGVRIIPYDPTTILRRRTGKVPKSEATFQTIISFMLWKCFKVCKSLKYSSDNWLYDCDLEKSHQDTPVLHNPNWRGIRTGGVLTGLEGFRATSGRRVLNSNWSLCFTLQDNMGPMEPIGRPVWTHFLWPNWRKQRSPHPFTPSNSILKR